MENYNIGYSTYVIGTSSNASNSLEIVLYNKSDWTSSPKLPKISLYNIDEVYKTLLYNEEKNNKYLRLNRVNTKDPFIYNVDNEYIKGFSIIIYISTVDNTPIGYTEFLNVQGISNSFNIFTSFNSNISDSIEVKLNNSLGQLRNNSTTGKNFSDNHTIYKYPSPETIKEDVRISDNYPRYTSHVYHILENKKMNILTDFCLINSDIKGASKITLNNNVNIDPYGHKYDNYQIGFYGNDIAIYSWSGNKFSIKSLIKRTRFGNPEPYTTNAGPDYSVIEDLGDNRSIFYFSGRFAVTITSNYPSSLELYDTERSIWISPKYSNFYLDTLDPRSRIISTPTNVSSNDISNYIPDIKNIFLDLNKFSKFSNIAIVKRTGDWFILKNKLSAIQDFHTYSNIDKAIHIVRISENPIIINNSLLMIRTIDSSNNLDYYTVYYEPGIEYYSEKARAALKNTTPKLDEELGILFYNGDDEETEKYRNYYKSGKIKIIHTNNPTGIYNNIFSGFRKGIYNESLSKSIPNIISSIYGFIYYIDSDGYLNYL